MMFIVLCADSRDKDITNFSIYIGRNIDVVFSLRRFPSLSCGRRIRKAADKFVSVLANRLYFNFLRSESELALNQCSSSLKKEFIRALLYD